MPPAAQISSKMGVLIADDHRLFAETLEALLATDARIDVVGHAHDGREAVDRAVELKPDVVLMDIDMPLMDGFEATRRILERHAGACILMLTGSNSREDVDRARQAGAPGYVTQDRVAAEVGGAIPAGGARWPLPPSPPGGQAPRGLARPAIGGPR